MLAFCGQLCGSICALGMLMAVAESGYTFFCLCLVHDSHVSYAKVCEGPMDAKGSFVDSACNSNAKKIPNELVEPSLAC